MSPQDMHNEIHQKLFVRVEDFKLWADGSLKRGVQRNVQFQKEIHTHAMEGHRKFLGMGREGGQNKKSSLWGVRIFSGTAQFLKDVYLYLLSINS